MLQETSQPHYQHHVESSSQVELFQQQSFCSPSVEPTQLFGYKDKPHMSFQSPFHQPPFNYSTFPSQQHFFVGLSNPFATSTMTPHLPKIQCHPFSIIDQQCLHRCLEIRVRTMKSNALTMTFHLRPLLPFHPNNNHKDDHEDNEEVHPVAQLLIDDNFSYISIF